MTRYLVTAIDGQEPSEPEQIPDDVHLVTPEVIRCLAQRFGNGECWSGAEIDDVLVTLFPGWVRT